MTKWTLMIPAALLLGALTANSSSVQQRPAVAPDTVAVVRDNNAFAVDLYRQLGDKDGNIFFSPHSISTALAMTYAGARGPTAREMAEAMRFRLPFDQLHSAFADLSKEIKGDGPRQSELRIANRLWGQKHFTFSPRFLRLTEDVYGARLKEVDFVNATEEARKTINSWVEGQTKDKIKELLKPGILNADTRLVLANAIYLKAHWQTPFDPKATKPAAFKRGAGDKQTVQAPTMHGSQRTRFLDADTFQAAELPYQAHELSMIVFLPKQVDGLAEFEKSLTADKLEAWQKKMSDHIVTMAMPKFTVTAEFSLNERLKEMGMKLAFEPGAADFTGDASFPGLGKLFISHVVHKAFVVVHEEGTEAAASTGVVLDTKSKLPRVDFIADHPFFYVIRDNRTGAILFMGRVSDPR